MYGGALCAPLMRIFEVRHMNSGNEAPDVSLSNDAMDELLRDSILLNPEFWEDSGLDETAESPREAEKPAEESNPLFQMPMPMDMLMPMDRPTSMIMPMDKATWEKRRPARGKRKPDRREDDGPGKRLTENQIKNQIKKPGKKQIKKQTKKLIKKRKPEKDETEKEEKNRNEDRPGIEKALISKPSANSFSNRKPAGYSLEKISVNAPGIKIIEKDNKKKRLEPARFNENKVKNSWKTRSSWKLQMK